jgi:hypothetical protein
METRKLETLGPDMSAQLVAELTIFQNVLPLVEAGIRW